MAPPDIESSIQASERDFELRTLAQIRGSLARLMYLASTRDYTNGRYHHEGLVWRYSLEAAQAALERCHERLFHEVSGLQVAGVVKMLEEYLDQQQGRADEIVRTWNRSQAYRVIVPLTSPPLENELFLSNMRIALAILAKRFSAPSSSD